MPTYQCETYRGPLTSVVADLGDEWHAQRLLERFTQAAGRAIAEARNQARAFGHHHIGDAHLLLGVLHEPGNRAAQILASRGVSEDAARALLLVFVPEAEKHPRSDSELAFTFRAKNTLECGLREAIALGAGLVGTEHLLLGLTHEPDGVAMRMLSNGWALYAEAVRGMTIEVLRSELIPPDRGSPVAACERN